MEELDKKLEELLQNNDAGLANEDMVKQIKQAFIDAGWKKHDKAGCVQFDLGEEQKAVLMAKVIEGVMPSTPVNYVADFSKGKLSRLMTREEWEQQAIKDGWVKIPSVHMTKEGWIEVSTDKGVRHNGVPLMTGQEWYDRFMEALSNHDFLDEDADKVVVAAKKASGIES